MPITNGSSKIGSFPILLLLRETSLFVVAEGDIGEEARRKSGSEPCKGLVREYHRHGPSGDKNPNAGAGSVYKEEPEVHRATTERKL